MANKNVKFNIELDTGDLIAPKKENRKHRRINAIRKVPIDIIDTGENIFHATLLDISNGGCRFSSEKTLSVDSFISIRLFPNSIIKGKVAWVKKFSNNNQYETGVEFSNEYREDIHVIAGVRLHERKKPAKNIDVIVSTKDEANNTSYKEISVLIDISEGGLQIKSKQPFVPGKNMHVRFPGGKVVRGQVRWCHRSADTIEKRYFSGVAFTKNDMILDEDNNEDILSGGDDIEYYNNLGRFLRKDKKYIEALDSYEKAIALQPKNEVLYFNRARIYMEMNQTDPAIEDLKYALRLNPNFSEASILLKEMLKQWKDH